jgi:hypothetical protein
MCWARRWKVLYDGSLVFCLIVELVPEEGIWQLGMLYLITCKFVCTIFIRVNKLGHMLTCSGLSCLIISFFNCHSWFFTAVDPYVIINLYRTRVEEKTLFCWLLGRLYLWGFNGLVICYCDAWPGGLRECCDAPRLGYSPFYDRESVSFCSLKSVFVFTQPLDYIKCIGFIVVFLCAFVAPFLNLILIYWYMCEFFDSCLSSSCFTCSLFSFLRSHTETSLCTCTVLLF